MHSLVIEDDLETASILANALLEIDMTAEVVHTGIKALSKLTLMKYDIIILDLMLPELDGRELLKKIRDGGIDTPVIISSALSNLPDRLEGFNLGADDYLAKPFSLSELQIRVQNLLRRSKKLRGETNLVIGELKVNRIHREVSRAGKKIDLLHNEYLLLELLMINSDKVLSKKNILKEIWKYDFDPQTNIVDVLVCRLREKIDKNYTKKMIHTVRGVGYTMREIKTEIPHEISFTQCVENHL